jgi:hypothetical protein
MSQRYLVPEEMSKRKQRMKNILLTSLCVVAIVLSAFVPFLASKI